MTKLSIYAQIGKEELGQALGSSNRKKYAEINIEVNEDTKEVETIIKSTESSDAKKCLSTTSLLFWMYLHYLSPDEQGLVQNISISDAAKFLSFSEKGIRNAIEKLSKYGYIYSSIIYKNTVTIMLPNFKNYFLKASEGGHGYFELSKENFLNVIAIANQRKKRATINNDEKTKYKDNSIVNQIRIKLRSFLICEHAQRMFQKGKKATITVIKNIDELLEFMPKYFYPKKLIKMLECLSDTIHYEVDKQNVKLEAKIEDFNGKFERKKNICKIEKDLKAKINKIDRALSLYNENKLSSKFLQDNGINVTNDFDYAYQSYIITENDIKDLAKLCLEFSKECVFTALEYTYSNFIVKGRTIRNFGALVRRSIQSYTS